MSEDNRSLRVDSPALARPASWLCVLLTAATLAWLLAQLDRGLELTDESFYLLSAIHADSVRLFFTPAHWVAGALWRTSGNLLGFRALGLGLAVLSALLLAHAVSRVACLVGMRGPQTAGERTAMLATAASGALLYGSLLNFTPSYNLLGASGACFAVALILLAAAAPPRRAWWLEALAGAALGITFLCKFSTAICVGAIMGALYAAITHGPALSWRRFPLVMFATAVATVGAATLLETGFGEALRQFRAGVEIVWLAQRDKAVATRLWRSAADLGGMTVGVATLYWGPLLGALIATRWLPAFFGLASTAWFAALLVRHEGLAAGMTHYEQQAVPLAAALVFAMVAGARQWSHGGRAVLLAGALAILPVAIAIGTSNPLHIQILGALAPWGALIALLGFSRSRGGGMAALASVLFCFIVLMQVIANGAEPYRMRALPQQAEAVALPALGSLRVDPATAAMARDLQRAAGACGVAAGAPFLDFYNIPGAALMLGAVPVDTPWLLDAAYAEVALRRADPATLRRAIVAVKLDDRGARPQPPPQLATFPSGYRRCGRARGPVDGRVVELWAPV